MEDSSAKAGGANRKEGVNPLYLVTSKSENSNLGRGSPKFSNDSAEATSRLSSEELSKKERQVAKGTDDKDSATRQVFLSRTLKPSSTLTSRKATKDWSVPAINCPEMIVLCVDISKDMRRHFTSDTKGKYSFIQTIEKALKIFISSKLNMKASHKFALMFLSDTALWIHDFTTDMNKLISFVKDAPECSIVDDIDMNDIFDVMTMKCGDHLNQCFSNSGGFTVTTYTYRLLIIYGRSKCVPKTDFNLKHSAFRMCERFTADVLYLFSDESQNNFHEKIFYNLGEFDFHGNSYIFAVNKPCEVFECFAQLLGHPFQRPFQHHIHHVLEE